MDQIVSDMFNGINEKEFQLLKDAIPAITVLMAQADGKIESKETEWAAKVTDIRSYAYKENLREYYASVGKEFEDKLNAYMEKALADPAASSEQLNGILAKVNKILPKLENEIGHDMYESLVSFAEHVAKASGGFLRFGTISREEKSLIKLPMLDPIELINPEDE